MTNQTDAPSDTKIVTTTTPEFVDFLSRAQAAVDMSLEGSSLPREVLFAENLNKLIRIVRPASNGQRFCWGFVAKVTFTTKALGTIQAGDFLKTATWKAPAKNSRGNIFLKNEKFTGYGAEYLK